MHPHDTAFEHLHRPEPRPDGLDRIAVAVVPAQRPIGQTPRDGLLLAGMHVPRLVVVDQIVGANHTHVVGHVHHPRLLLAHQRLVHVLLAVLMGCDLDVVERLAFAAPQLPPVVDHRHHLVGVTGAAPDIRAALIPAEPLDRKVMQRVNHPVVKDFDRIHAALPLARGDRRRVEIGEPALQRRREPRFDPRAAATAVDDPHGDVQRPTEVAAEQVADGAEGLDAPGRGFAPGTRHILPGTKPAVDFHREEPHVGVLRTFGDDLLRMFDRAVAASLHGDLHVGLPRAEPHLADEDILQHDGFAVAVAQGDAARLERGGRGCDRHAPASLLVGLRPYGAAPRGCDADFGLGRRPAPELHFAGLLQHHVVAHDGGQLDFRFGRRPCRAQQEHQRTKPSHTRNQSL